ncbi:hypothetical protein H0H81_008726 [Sphagnurus paluster]|uniref:FAD-binding domain-containing protein n=1 Tax=Sphagnurus paluster TaxID=117069 RepID=A0A9P7KI96_9AGAR|nr:hypothetical protein H0H81_008726 [Sphagnurus paluster]
MFGWFGNGRICLGIPLGGNEDFAMFVYGPADGQEGDWETAAPAEAMRRILEPAESRLRKLGALAAPPVCIPVTDFPELEDWVHESGNMVLIGEAAHPLPPGAIQMCAMAVEDGAVLAKLFSHLRTEDQISSFLYAFEALRQGRCRAVQKKEFGDIFFMSFPPGPMQEGRDAALRAARDAGRNVLESGEDAEETPEWSEIKEVFGYDAEDEADNWWQEWGILRERAQGRDVMPAGDMQSVFGNVVVERQVGG